MKLKNVFEKSFRVLFSDEESRSYSDCSYQRLRVVHVDGIVEQVSRARVQQQQRCCIVINLDLLSFLFQVPMGI